MAAQETFGLASYASSGVHGRAGIVVADHVFDAGASVLDLLRDWPAAHARLRERARALQAAAPAEGLALKDVRLLPPVLYPGAIFCAGANYRDHVEEMSRALNLPPEPDPHSLGLKPWHFVKPAVACLRGNGERIALPGYSRRVDWEAEIALVIGRPCRNVAVEHALDYVAGITIVNDLSARDHIRRTQLPPESPFCFDWVSHKCFEGSLPAGPWIRPLDQVRDLDDLRIQLWVNDELMQDSSSRNLIFSCAEQVAHLSTRVLLRPGDLIATGTPAGCGAARGRFLAPGDSVRIRVDQIGELYSEFVS